MRGVMPRYAPTSRLADGGGVMFAARRVVQAGLTGGRALDTVEATARARAGAGAALAGFAARAAKSFDLASRGLRRGHLQG